MKVLAVAFVVLLAVAYAAEEEQPKEEEEEITTYRRLIPADTLRDFPGTCFASTRCATFEPKGNWSLSPFCGRSTCIESNGRLWELVEDCGPLPLPNAKCAVDLEKTNKDAEFPYCCPRFKCEPGAKLEFPIPFNPEESTSPAGPETSGVSSPRQPGPASSSEKPKTKA